MNVGVNNIKIDINITPCKKKGLFNAELQQAFNWAGVRPGGYPRLHSERWM